jgi:hypothetical protein
MTDTARPLHRNDVLVNQLGEQIVLYSAQGQAIHVLNVTAGLIWALCDGEHSIQDMERAVQSSFAVPEGHDVRADVQRILEEFSSKGLLQQRA